MSRAGALDAKIEADNHNKAQAMALRDESPKVGVYIDFENLHATFADAQFGDGSYRENRMSVQPMFFDIVPILHYAASLGDIVICKVSPLLGVRICAPLLLARNAITVSVHLHTRAVGQEVLRLSA